MYFYSDQKYIVSRNYVKQRFFITSQEWKQNVLLRLTAFTEIINSCKVHNLHKIIVDIPLMYSVKRCQRSVYTAMINNLHV